MSVRGGIRISPPQGSSNYPPIQEDPQVGGPSNPAPVSDPAPATLVPPSSPMGFGDLIPTYPDATGYSLYEPQAPTGYGTYDPYNPTTVFNALYPPHYPPPHPSVYVAYGYPYPPPQQP
ncbi:hypothetical protein Hanom_Chr04g00361741 [Helianthus anomalus]